MLPWQLLSWLTFLILPLSHAQSLTPAELHDLARRYTKRTSGGVHLPIVRQETQTGIQRRAGQVGAIGLGDYVDVTYNVLITVGGITTPVVLDTGSSDFWVLSSSCTSGCTGTVALYPQSTFQSTNLDAKLLYGDSLTGTYAFGVIGKDKVDLAGLALEEQYFAAINRTNTSITETGSAGIFGLGFPINSVLWNTVFTNDMTTAAVDIQRRSGHIPMLGHRSLSASHSNHLSRILPSIDFHRPTFPSLADIYSSFSSPSLATSNPSSKRQTSVTSPLTTRILASYPSLAPFLPRLISTAALAAPVFAVTLQRDTVDVGGNAGLLSIGELPEGVKNESLTWVPLRGYTPAEGGLAGPSDSPGEVYPIAWEVFVDDVFLDGVKLPKSNLSSSSIKLSALIDTGNSLIRGPQDVTSLITAALGGSQFPCSVPHTLAFQIGGQLFPVDPRDLVRAAFEGSADACESNVVGTDAPGVGGYLFSWSLGMPFLKSVLSAYHFGNLTHPSRDPPSMGFLSTVPTDASDKLKSAVAAAAKAGGGLTTTSQAAPSGTPLAAKTNSNGVPEASGTSTGGGTTSDARKLTMIPGWFLVLLLLPSLAV